LILLVSKKLIKNFEESWLNTIGGNRNFAWFWFPPNGRSGGLLVGFDAVIFDVREKELGEFMIRILVVHKETCFYLELHKRVWGCSN
jgi:hypothetical protein